MNGPWSALELASLNSVIRCQMSGIHHPVSGIHHPMPGIHPLPGLPVFRHLPHCRRHDLLPAEGVREGSEDAAALLVAKVFPESGMQVMEQ
jgi:hypothetical protein